MITPPSPTLRQIFWSAFANGMRRVAQWRREGMLGKRNLERRRRSLRFEALEPRLLLSADLTYNAVASGDLTLRASDLDGIGTLELVVTDEPGVVLASQAIASIDGSSGYGARIDAAGHDITLRIDASAELAGIAGGIVFVGGDGTSALAGADLENTWLLAGEGSGGVGSVSFSGVEKLIGGGAADTLAGAAGDTLWSISGLDAGEVAGMLFAGMENLQGAADNEDTFVVGEFGGLSGVMDGGAGGFDSMVLSGGTFSTVEYLATGPQSGFIVRDGAVLAYDGLEPITDTSTVADRVISTAGTAPASLPDVGLLGDDRDDRATLTDNGDGTLTLAPVSPFFTFETVTFNDPTNSLTINLSGDLDIPFLSKDVLTVNSFDVAGVDLIVNGEEGKDEVAVVGAVNARNVTINAELITV
jgi:hypothetical protein